MDCGHQMRFALKVMRTPLRNGWFWSRAVNAPIWDWDSYSIRKQGSYQDICGCQMNLGAKDGEFELENE